jgi:hypothetical protein
MTVESPEGTSQHIVDSFVVLTVSSPKDTTLMQPHTIALAWHLNALKYEF